jgi:spore coat protein U-like protein
MRKTTIALGLFAALLTAPVFAGSTSGNLTVQATVVAACNLNTSAATGGGNGLLSFGTNITSTLSNVDADTTAGGNYGVSMVCTTGTKFTVTANNGANASGTQNQMKGTAGGLLPYNLYTDSGRTVAAPTSGTSWSFTGTGSAQAIPVYGRILAGTTLPAPDTYTDTVLLTIAY